MQIEKFYNKLIIISLFLFFALASVGFGENLKENTKLPMLWDFGAKKCIPCIKMAPILEKIETEYKGKLIVKFTDVWKSENIHTAKEYGIQSIPTQIFFDKEGKELWRHAGFISEEGIFAKWKSLGYDFSKLETKTETSK